MPVEIRELLVKTTIEGGEAKKPGASAPGTGSAEGGTPAPSPAKNDNARAQERLLKECVNMIMDNFSSFTKER
jgi:hypothetical protein